MMKKIKVYIVIADGFLHEVLTDPIETERLVKHLVATGRSTTCTAKWVNLREGYYAE